MITTIQIELSDHARDHLADMIDQRASKRLATRKEIRAICHQHIAGLISQQADALGIQRSPAPLRVIDPEDATMLRGKPASYIRGWNQEKRS